MPDLYDLRAREIKKLEAVAARVAAQMLSSSRALPSFRAATQEPSRRRRRGYEERELTTSTTAPAATTATPSSAPNPVYARLEYSR
jgi:hypothetical protein